MKTKTGWIIAIIVGAVLLLVVPALFMMAGPWWGGYGGMMGGGYGGMMGGGFGFMHPFGWVGMLLGWLVSIAVLILLVLGVVWLVNTLIKSGGGSSTLVPSQTCPNCGKPIESAWNTCPHCGKPLK